MTWLEFKLARDETQATLVSVRLDAIEAVVEVDAKKTAVMVNGQSIGVHGSFTEVMNKVRGASS